MREHELKIEPDYFDGVISRQKTFEHRYNDRDFQTGDTLYLREYIPKRRKYTGRNCTACITYITNFPVALKEGFVCMAIAVKEINK